MRITLRTWQILFGSVNRYALAIVFSLLLIVLIRRFLGSFDDNFVELHFLAGLCEFFYKHCLRWVNCFWCHNLLHLGYEILANLLKELILVLKKWLKISGEHVALPAHSLKWAFSKCAQMIFSLDMKWTDTVENVTKNGFYSDFALATDSQLQDEVRK